MKDRGEESVSIPLQGGKMLEKCKPQRTTQ